MVKRISRRVALIEVFLLVVMLAGANYYISPPPPAPGTYLSVIDAPGAGEVRRDVTYCTAGNVAMHMDLFFPQTSSTQPSPVALYIHGGGWTSGSKDWLGRVVDPNLLTAKGFLVAAVDYRLAPQYKWPAQIQDVKCAVRYLRTNAAAYHLDPGRIGAFGESAGGHLASLLGLTGPGAGFEGTGGYSDQSSRVEAVVDMCGPSDFEGYNFNTNLLLAARLVLGVSPVPSALEAASPVSYVDHDAPPFLIIQGEEDPLVPPAQSQELYKDLTAAGADASLTMVKNAGHVFAPVGGDPSPSMPQIQASVVDFFSSKLAQPNSRYFAATGKVVRGALLDYWDTHGGLAQQGYPIADEMQEKSPTDAKPYTVQYFERSVMERHPENPPSSSILLSLLGSRLYSSKYPAGAPGQRPNQSAGSVLFSQTGHRVGGLFLQYWQGHGGLAQQGYPISDEFTEISALDGKPYTVQYFERAVFELHPENPPASQMLLSQLGRFSLEGKAGK